MHERNKMQKKNFLVKPHWKGPLGRLIRDWEPKAILFFGKQFVRLWTILDYSGIGFCDDDDDDDDDDDTSVCI